MTKIFLAIEFLAKIIVFWAFAEGAISEATVAEFDTSVHELNRRMEEPPAVVLVDLERGSLLEAIKAR